jgi:hypothetical protein
MICLRFFAVIFLVGLSACGAFQRSDDAAAAKTRMVGLSREAVLACMGVPKKKASEGTTEVWSYLSTSGHGESQSETYKPTGFAFTNGSHDRNFCTVNVVMKDGVVTRVNYNGPSTSSLFTSDDQCGYAVANCVDAGSD